MNIDIEKIEKYVLCYYDRDKFHLSDIICKHFLHFGYLCCFIALPSFAWALSLLHNIENINTYHFLWILFLIPITALLSLKFSKHLMNSLSYEKYDSAFASKVSTVSALIATTFYTVYRPNMQQSLIAMTDFIMFVLLGLACVFAASGRFHRSYMARKYAPYFKDERLRGAAVPAETGDATDKPER